MANDNPTYTYLIADLTNTPVSGANLIGELRGIYGIYIDKNLSKPGNMTFSMRIDSPLMSSDDIEYLTRPGMRKIWVYRDSNLAWSGIIWSRTYQSNGRVLNCTAQTTDSYLARVIFPFNYTDFQFPHNLILDIWAQIPTIVGTYFVGQYPRDWALPALQTGFGAGNTLTVDGYQAPFLDSLVATCVKWGGEYRVQSSAFGSLNGRWDYVEVGMWTPPPSGNFTVGLWPQNKRTVIQYPGSITDYWWPESLGTSAGGASSLYMVGKGTTKANTPFALINNILPTGMVSTSRRILDESITNQVALTQAATNIAPAFQQPITNPTFVLDASHNDISLPPSSSGLDVGDYFDYVIADPLRWTFGAKRYAQARVAGWVLKPPASDSPEQFGVSIVDQLSTVVDSGVQ